MQNRCLPIAGRLCHSQKPSSPGCRQCRRFSQHPASPKFIAVLKKRGEAGECELSGLSGFTGLALLVLLCCALCFFCSFLLIINEVEVHRAALECLGLKAAGLVLAPQANVPLALLGWEEQPAEKIGQCRGLLFRCLWLLSLVPCSCVDKWPLPMGTDT